MVNSHVRSTKEYTSGIIAHRTSTAANTSWVEKWTQQMNKLKFDSNSLPDLNISLWQHYTMKCQAVANLYPTLKKFTPSMKFPKRLTQSLKNSQEHAKSMPDWRSVDQPMLHMNRHHHPQISNCTRSTSHEREWNHSILDCDRNFLDKHVNQVNVL